MLILAMIAAVPERPAAVAGSTYQERDCSTICWPGSPAQRVAAEKVMAT
jgi:hypothetical protein